jgi:hypothetical protein
MTQGPPPGKSHAERWKDQVTDVLEDKPPNYAPPPQVQNPVIIFGEVTPEGLIHLRLHLGGSVGNVDVEMVDDEGLALSDWITITFGEPTSVPLTAGATLRLTAGATLTG